MPRVSTVLRTVVGPCKGLSLDGSDGGSESEIVGSDELDEASDRGRSGEAPTKSPGNDSNLPQGSTVDGLNAGPAAHSHTRCCTGPESNVWKKLVSFAGAAPACIQKGVDEPA